MKKTMKTPVKNQKSLIVRLDELTQGGAVTECRNLMSVSRGGQRMLSVAPGLSSLGQGYSEPLASYVDPSGSTHTLFSRAPSPGGSAGWMILSGDRSFTGAAPSELLCAMPVEGGFIVMTETGSARLSMVDGAWTFVADSALSASGVRLEAIDCGELSVWTDPLTLSDVTLSRDGSTIGASGRRRLTSTLCDGYNRLSEVAMSGSMWIQPVVARFHLINDSGDRVYSSVPMAVSAPGGWQCVEALSAECSAAEGRLIVPSFTMKANAFRLGVKADADTTERLRAAGVRGIEVTVTPQIQPFDPSQTAPYRIVRPTSAAPLLEVALPGATADFSALGGVRADLVRQVIASVDQLERREALLGLGYYGVNAIYRGLPMPPKIEISKITRAVGDSGGSTAIGGGSGAADALLGRIQLPNRFIARTVACVGDTVGWADITTLPAAEVNLHELCADWRGAAFSGVLTVAATDGEFRMPVSGSSTPHAWRPSVSYPDSGVFRLTIDILSESGERLHSELTLAPDGSGARAVAVNAGLGEIGFETVSDPMPQSGAGCRSTVRRPGAIVGCDRRDPLRPVVALECCHSPVVALHPAVRSQSSWDFSRCHLYALTNHGIYTVNLNAATAVATATMIDSRGSDCRRASVYTPLGVFALHRGQLLKISGSRVDTLAVDLNEVEVAWDSEQQRIWTLDLMGQLRMISPDSMTIVEIESPADFKHVATVDNRLWLTDVDELYRRESGDEKAASDALRPISWVARTDLPPGARPTALAVHLSASYFNGSISLLGASSVGSPPGLLHKLNICGRVGSPVVNRLVAPCRPLNSIKIKGMASTDFKLQSITIYYELLR